MHAPLSLWWNCAGCCRLATGTLRCRPRSTAWSQHCGRWQRARLTEPGCLVPRSDRARSIGQWRVDCLHRWCGLLVRGGVWAGRSQVPGGLGSVEPAAAVSTGVGAVKRMPREARAGKAQQSVLTASCWRSLPSNDPSSFRDGGNTTSEPAPTAGGRQHAQTRQRGRHRGQQRGSTRHRHANQKATSRAVTLAEVTAAVEALRRKHWLVASNFTTEVGPSGVEWARKQSSSSSASGASGGSCSAGSCGGASGGW